MNIKKIILSLLLAGVSLQCDAAMADMADYRVSMLTEENWAEFQKISFLCYAKALDSGQLGLPVEKFIESMQEAWACGDINVQSATIGLCEALVKQSHAIDEALTMIEKWLLLPKFEKPDYGIETAIKSLCGAVMLSRLSDWSLADLADQALQQSELVCKKKALLVYQIMANVVDGHLLDRAVNAADQGLLSGDRDIQFAAFKIYETFINKGIAFEQAMNVAESLMSKTPEELLKNKKLKTLSDNPQHFVVYLYNLLVPRGHALEQAAEIVRTKMNDFMPATHHLQNALKDKGYSF